MIRRAPPLGSSKTFNTGLPSSGSNDGSNSPGTGIGGSGASGGAYNQVVQSPQLAVFNLQNGPHNAGNGGGVGGGSGMGPGGVNQQQPGAGIGGTAGTSSDGQSNSAAGGQGPEMNLANVLHYLQSEWRRWERDRNEWEIERAEMRARIALLEGQRRSAENLKVDLLRRVKMLEFALKQERTRTGQNTSTRGPASTVAPSRLAALQDEDKSSRDEREGSGSSEAGEDLAERLKSSNNGANGIHPAALGGKSPTIPSTRNPSLSDTSSWKNLSNSSGALRDPKARARSREYLKQCLQEITYLTSPGALNPLNPRPPITVDGALAFEMGQGQGSGGVGGGGGGEVPLPQPGLDRPIKVLPDLAQPSNTQPSEEQQQPPQSNGVQEVQPLPTTEKESTTGTAQLRPAQPSSAAIQPPLSTSSDLPTFHEPSPITSTEKETSQTPSQAPVRTDAEPPSSPAPRTVTLPDSEPGPLQTPSTVGEKGEPQSSLTAIYRPHSSTAWREELRTANEQAEKTTRNERREPTDEEQLASLTLSTEDEEPHKQDEIVEHRWTTKRTLKSHLDIVRAIAFTRGPNTLLVSGSDDYTVKVWPVDASSITSLRSSAIMDEIEPIVTYRGHTAPITAIEVSTAQSIIFSASLDTTIQLWKLPSPQHDLYGPFDPEDQLQVLTGHTDAVWDLCLLPMKSSSGKQTESTTLVSASADGTVKVWESSDAGSSNANGDSSNGVALANGGKKWHLTLSFSIAGGAIPTCLSAPYIETGKIVVGLSSGLVKIYDVETGAELHSFGEEGSQVNAVVRHPFGAILTGHEDGRVHIFDFTSGTPSSSSVFQAHPSPVTSLALAAMDPTTLFTASTDTTVRVWNLRKNRCVQDLAGHRARADEGVTQVAAHTEMGIVASAGADGVIRLWGEKMDS